MLIDTHCHLDFKDFDDDRDAVVDRALNAGVKRIINVASSVEGSRRSVELAGKYDIVHATVGVHPHEAASVTDDVISELKALAKSGKVAAIGEVGLDYYRCPTPKEVQAAAFKRFIHLAIDLDLPIIIHAREADRDALDILKEEAPRGLRGVVHCFSGSSGFMKECLDFGLFVSFTANLTFKKADALRIVARDMPPERLLLETDAPFLAPQAMRGKRNEPAYITHLAGEWSRLLGLSREDVARITTHNANYLFKLGLDESSKTVYEIRDSLYLNITNRCTNSCFFCIRSQTPFIKGHNLKIDREPSVRDIVEAVKSAKKPGEIVFCGYGEPTSRLEVVKEAAGIFKRDGFAKIRLVTNGQGDLINSKRIAGELAGLVDKVSVSLNTDTPELYDKYCRSEFGSRAYGAIRDFIKDCVWNKIEAEATFLDLPGVDLKRCEAIAKELGAAFRLRSLGVVG
ncbi:MAG: TatD family hydrolase [Candidatus Omnitrophota bacterium]